MSSILAQIKRGIAPRAQRIVIYGVESVGKTTLAAQTPNPLFLDVEDGTSHLDVPRLSVNSWTALEQAVKEVAAGGHEFKTLVVDSADWAEKLAVEDMLARDKKNSIEDYGYGKGYTILAEKMTRWLALLDSVIARGIHVVLIAHAKVARHEPPDGMQAYDRFELKLTKQSSPLVKEWADALLFANFKTRIVEAESGKAKGVGGKERVIYTQRSAAWDAKCRVPGVPEEIPMAWESVAPIFGNAQPVATAKPLEQVKPDPAKVEPEASQEALINELLGKVLNGDLKKITAATVALKNFGWLAQDAEITSLAPHYAKKILERPEAFLKKLELA
jgi:hypothetical protein